MNYNEQIKNIAKELGDDKIWASLDGFSNEVFIGKKFIYKRTNDELKISKGDHLKEKKVLEILKKNDLKKIPSFVKGFNLIDNSYLQVHSRIKGNKVKKLNDKMVLQICDFLSELHTISVDQKITEFDNEKDQKLDFDKYVKSNLQKYCTSLLSKDVSNSDIQLIDLAKDYLNSFDLSVYNDRTLSLIHKDIYEDNLIEYSGNIVGFIDWETAQISPLEWELAIIRQRMPEFWDLFITNYPLAYDLNLLKICGVLQSLRFWKSFPHQEEFANQQKMFIKKIIKNEGF